MLEAAAVAGVGESTIRDMVRNETLAHTRVGRRILIKRSDLMAKFGPEPEGLQHPKTAR